jgi:hypothetical protein
VRARVIYTHLNNTTRLQENNIPCCLLLAAAGRECFFLADGQSFIKAAGKNAASPGHEYDEHFFIDS